MHSQKGQGVNLNIFRAVGDRPFKASWKVPQFWGASANRYDGRPDPPGSNQEIGDTLLTPIGSDANKTGSEGKKTGRNHPGPLLTKMQTGELRPALMVKYTLGKLEPGSISMNTIKNNFISFFSTKHKGLITLIFPPKNSKFGIIILISA